MTLSPDNFDTSGLELVPMEGEESTNPHDGYTAEQQAVDAQLYNVVEKPVIKDTNEVNTLGMPEDYSNDPVVREYKRQISLHLDNLDRFIETRTNNLKLRTSGQISGVELDRLDAEVDRAIDHSYSEIARLREGIRENIDYIKNESGLS